MRPKRDALLVAIRADLNRVARETDTPEGFAPSLVDYRERGRFGEVKVRAVVGGWTVERGRLAARLTWSEAMERLGLTPYHKAQEVSDDELIRDLRRVGLLCGREPNELCGVEEYRAHGRYSYMTVLRRFASDGSWWTVARYLGMQPSSAVRRGSLSPERLIEDYRRIALEMGYKPGGFGPTRREFARRVPYSVSNVRWHVGSWSEFVRRVGFEARPVPGRKAKERERKVA